MAWYFIVSLFILSCFILAWLSSRLIKDLVAIGKYLRCKEFILVFFIVAFATSLPNLFVGISASLRGTPELALGDILGGNLADLTLVLAIAVFFTRRGIKAESETVQKTALVTSAIAILPLPLMADGYLGRLDGLILISSFFGYAYWVFSKNDRFQKIYNMDNGKHPVADFKKFLFNLLQFGFLILLMVLASQAVISSASFFAENLNISLALVGLIIVGLGNVFPETYFSIIAARKEKNWLVLGELMGSIIVCATLILGLLAFMWPFEIKNLSLFLTARIFLVIAAILSLLFIRSGKKITKKEGLILLFVYISFLIVEIFMR